MIIKTKQELDFCICADRIINRGAPRLSFKERFKNILVPDIIMSYLVAMRKVSYYKNKSGLIGRFLFFYHYSKYRRLGLRLGFSIGYNVFGYGLKIPHYGTIVVGGTNRIGNYSVLHTSTCISDNGKVIGDGLYLATGAKITTKVNLGDNVSIGANSLVNKSFTENNILLAGMPARIVKESEPWYKRDSFTNEVEAIESLKQKYPYVFKDV